MTKTLLYFLVGTWLALSSCAISSGHSSDSLPITQNGFDRKNWDITRISDSPFVYRLSHEDGQIFFATKLKECGVKKKTSLSSFSRELFVGFENLNIFKKDINDTTVTMEAIATIEKSPIYLVSRSELHDSCVIETVCWREISETDLQKERSSINETALNLIETLTGKD